MGHIRGKGHHRTTASHSPVRALVVVLVIVAVLVGGGWLVVRHMQAAAPVAKPDKAATVTRVDLDNKQAVPEPVVEHHGNSPDCPDTDCISMLVNGDLLFHPTCGSISPVRTPPPPMARRSISRRCSKP